MSFLKKGGTGNPFAANAQSGSQQPRGGFQGNNNMGGRGGGRSGQHNQHQGQHSNHAGGRGGIQTNSNPFATGKSTGVTMGGINQAQHATFQTSNNFGRGQHQPAQSNNFNKPQGKANSNPFASGGGGGGGSMEMDGSSSSHISTGFGNQTSFRQQPINSTSTGSRAGSGNPFAASNQQSAANMIVANGANAAAGYFGQNQGTTSNFSSFSSQPQNTFQSSHPSQGFNGGSPFNQVQQQPQNVGFGRGANPQPPQSANPFFGGGQHQQHQAVPAAPVRAEVNQQAINAVNMSAALAPSRVEELDLGLGTGLLDTVDGVSSNSSAASGQAIMPPVPPLVHTGASVTEFGADAIAQQSKTLLMSILSACPASALSEEPPAQADVDELRSVLVAGRISAVPPARFAAVSAGR